MMANDAYTTLSLNLIGSYTQSKVQQADWLIME